MDRIQSCEPFYQPLNNEEALFEQAWRHGMPVLIKGPTGAARPASSSTWPIG
jgi:hypothetical protein